MKWTKGYVNYSALSWHVTFSPRSDQKNTRKHFNCIRNTGRGGSRSTSVLAAFSLAYSLLYTHIHIRIGGWPVIPFFPYFWRVVLTSQIQVYTLFCTSTCPTLLYSVFCVLPLCWYRPLRGRRTRII